MKLLKITFLFVLLTSFNLNAQGLFKEKKEKIMALKVAFITDELKLTPDEASKFWPVYNAFDEKQQSIRRQKLKNYISKIDDDNFSDMSEKDASDLLVQMESSEEEMFTLRKKFINSLKGVLPSLKIVKLKRTEEEFNRKLLQQYKRN